MKNMVSTNVTAVDTRLRTTGPITGIRPNIIPSSALAATVTTGQADTYSSGTWNQSKTEDFGRSLNFTTYPNPDWKPVEAIFGQYGSLVGCTMVVKPGRSSDSTWGDFFTNNL